MLAFLLLQSSGAAQVERNATMTITVIPLLILYLALIAWLTYDASQDSAWAIWLMLFILAGPVSIPFYIWSAHMARRGTPQDVLDARAEEKRGGAKYRFASEIERMKWEEGQQPGRGTVFDP